MISEAISGRADNTWSRTEPFPIAADPMGLKTAVWLASQCKTQLEAALKYAEYGIPVIPCNWKPNEEGFIKKYPLVRAPGVYRATIDPEQIKQWWTKDPVALIGVPGGWATGMWFLDVDSKEAHDDDGLANWWELESQNGSAVTRSHKTGTNGLHFIYRWDPDRPIGCPTSTVPPGMEVKGEGGYVIFPPSPYVWKGQTVSYDICHDLVPEPAPTWLVDKILGSRSKANGKSEQYEFKEGWGKQKLDEVCRLVREATVHHWDEVCRTKVFLFGRWCGGGAYPIEAAREEILKAAKQCQGAPANYPDHAKRAFDNGLLQPLAPPEEARIVVLPPSQWFGEQPAPIPPALIKGILPQTGVATIGGQSGTGKSFHAIHLGVRLIPDCNQNFYIDKYRIKRKGGVLYLVLEGKPAFPMRVTAAFEQLLPKQLEWGDRYRMPFAWNTYAPFLFEKGPDALLRLADREAKKMRQEFNVDLVAIFLDTMGLAACFENENMAAQVQRVVAGLSRLSDVTGALSINVDHMGKDADAGMRGTSAKRDCVETILACFCDRDNGDKPTNHRMQLLKVRDGEEGRVIPYRLEPVDMGVDEDGERVKTAVIKWECDRPMPKKKNGRPRKNDFTMQQAINEVGGLPVDVGKLREAFNRIHGGNTKAVNTAWHRAVKDMGLGLNGGLVCWT
jgi:hypothetical protein